MRSGRGRHVAFLSLRVRPISRLFSSFFYKESSRKRLIHTPFIIQTCLSFLDCFSVSLIWIFRMTSCFICLYRAVWCLNLSMKRILFYTHKLNYSYKVSRDAWWQRYISDFHSCAPGSNALLPYRVFVCMIWQSKNYLSYVEANIIWWMFFFKPRFFYYMLF